MPNTFGRTHSFLSYQRWFIRSSESKWQHQQKLRWLDFLFLQDAFKDRCDADTAVAAASYCNKEMTLMLELLPCIFWGVCVWGRLVPDVSCAADFLCEGEGPELFLQMYVCCGWVLFGAVWFKPGSIFVIVLLPVFWASVDGADVLPEPQFCVELSNKVFEYKWGGIVNGG